MIKVTCIGFSPAYGKPTLVWPDDESLLQLQRHVRGTVATLLAARARAFLLDGSVGWEEWQKAQQALRDFTGSPRYI